LLVFAGTSVQQIRQGIVIGTGVDDVMGDWSSFGVSEVILVNMRVLAVAYALACVLIVWWCGC
jgi:hypothetical protein